MLLHGYSNGSPLISFPWLNSRYDARLLFTDKAQFVSKPSQTPPVLTPEEEEMERRFDEERYLDLHHDTQEYELQQGKL